ncbi:adenylyltransferase/cytidyltransferase family protein [Rubripirellula amarantea]|nr:adenylyltransferase/cytidyltransferase family protein [Rubripirellula amarantea]
MSSIESKLLEPGQCGAKLSGLQGRIGFCTGCFDILQSGHAVFFEQCKECCDHLVVVVGRGKNIGKLKPGRPINQDNNRLFLVAALEPVDFAVLGDEEYSMGKIDCVTFCDDVHPDVYIVNDDDSGLDQKRDFSRDRGIELVTVPRVVPSFLQPTSTTEIIEKAKISTS